MCSSDLEPFEGEQTLEQYASSMVIGDAHHVAERMIADIRRIEPTHYACNFQFGCLPYERASRSLRSFARDVLPLIERELGPLPQIQRSTRAAAEVS